jgi:hypothetical protein
VAMQVNHGQRRSRCFEKLRTGDPENDANVSTLRRVLMCI